MPRIGSNPVAVVCVSSSDRELAMSESATFESTAISHLDIVNRFRADAIDNRYHLHESWVRHGHLIATDGRIACLVKIDEPDEDAGKKRPDVLKIWNSVPRKAAFKASSTSFPKCKRCGTLGGKIVKEKKCETCNGEGTRQCDLGHYHDCRDCRGCGHVQSTDGVERFIVCEPLCSIPIGTCRFARHYVRRIQDVIPGELTWRTANDVLFVESSEGFMVILMACSK